MGAEGRGRGTGREGGIHGTPDCRQVPDVPSEWPPQVCPGGSSPELRVVPIHWLKPVADHTRQPCSGFMEVPRHSSHREQSRYRGSCAAAPYPRQLLLPQHPAPHPEMLCANNPESTDSIEKRLHRCPEVQSYETQSLTKWGYHLVG